VDFLPFTLGRVVGGGFNCWLKVLYVLLVFVGD
jgi:hypothetical protein